MSDPVHHPAHYAGGHPVFSGECIDYTRQMGFDNGNAFKYLWRWDKKELPVQDLNKALWYLDDAIRSRDAVVLSRPDTELVERLEDELRTYCGRADRDENIVAVARIQVRIAHGIIRVSRDLLADFIARYEAQVS